MRRTVPEGADALRYHGGAVEAARRTYPDAPEPWIDLSTGINPLAYPVGDLSPSVWARLPEPAAVAALEQAAHQAYGAGPLTEIVAAPGTQALLQWLPRLLRARRVGIVGFTYAEHERCWQAAGATVATVATLADLVEFDLGVVVNPNNPDGRMVAPDDLAATADRMARRGGQLLVDEAFMDVFGHQFSLLPQLPGGGAVVLRSFGKSYGLGGLRLGFAAASPTICAQLRSAMGPWAVSGPAIEIGRRALADTGWLAASAARLTAEAERLDQVLQSAGFAVVGGTPLFRLVQHAAAGAMFTRLCRNGILTRPFQAKPDWLRFGIPHAEPEWERLRAALIGPADLDTADTVLRGRL